MARYVITGSNRGIGLALCRALAGRGEHVIAVCRESSRALDALDVRVESGVDVTRPDALNSFAESLGDEPIDVLINNAGVLSRQAFGEIDERAIEDIVTQFRVNALGPLLVTQALASRLAEPAKVAIITSRMGSIEDNTSGGHYGYRMSKAAVNAMGKSLAHDLAGRGVAVALLHPGYVSTDMTSGSGEVEPEVAAAGLIARIDELDLNASGGFWHAQGQRLPW